MRFLLPETCPGLQALQESPGQPGLAHRTGLSPLTRNVFYNLTRFNNRRTG